MKRKAKVISGMVCISILLFGFGAGNYYTITKADVELKVPPGFPKPSYSFKDNKLTPEKFVLGRKLFYDPVLSKDSTISCASCHQRIAAFAHIDHPLSHGINGLIGKRNVPALQNLVWKDAYMWDGGVNNLEVQPINPITSPIEMNESLAGVVEKLENNKAYAAEFATAFGEDKITSAQVLKALAQFTGLMISANSRYDRYMGHTDTLSVAETRGLALFRSKCGSCHHEPLFTDNSYRHNGLKPDTALKDKGRAVVTGDERDDYKFQVPTLRNVGMTYPYMHDGRFRKLKDVLNYYGNPANFDKHAAKEMQEIGVLSEEQKSDIIAFLLTLNDKTFIYDRRFIDPFMQ